jgi:hypothetical protein
MVHRRLVAHAQGCIWSHDHLKPGEETELAFVVEPGKTPGAFTHYVALKSDDIQAPQCVVIVSGRVVTDQIIYQDSVEFGTLFPGAKETRVLKLYDDGTDTLKVSSATVQAAPSQDPGGSDITCDWISTTEMDYVALRIEATIPLTAPVHDLSAGVVIRYRLRGQAREMRVPINGSVAGPWMPEPRSLMLIGSPDERLSAKRVIKFSCVDPERFSSSPSVTAALEGLSGSVAVVKENGLQLELALKTQEPVRSPLDGTILCEIDDYRVTIPCVILPRDAYDQE